MTQRPLSNNSRVGETFYVNKAINQKTTDKPNLWPLKIKGQYATADQLSFWESRIAAEHSAYLASSHLVETSDPSIGLKFGYTIIQGSKEKPPSYVDEYQLRTVTKNPNFHARREAGEIIMSPMVNTKVSVVCESIITSDFPPSKSSATITWGTLGYKDSPDGLVLAPGVIAGSHRESTVAFGYFRETSNRAYWSVPPIIPARGVWDQLSLSYDSTGLITNAYGDANKKAVDVLTAFAEMPETIKSCLSGLKEIARLVKDVRKKNFELLKNRNLKVQKRKERHTRQIARLNARIRSETDVRKVRLLERQKRDRQKDLAKDIKSFMDEFISALANLWLNFRYNIMPNVYLCEDVVKAINDYNEEYTNTSKKDADDLDVLFKGIVIGTIPVQCKAIIKRQFDLSNIKWNSTLSANLVTTAYELLPLSFVVDWFVNIGDILSSVTTPPSWKQQAAGLRLKFDGKSSQTVDKPEIKANIKIAVDSYLFKTFNPLDEIGLCFPMDLSPVRQLDALALIWRPVRLLLTNALKR